MISASVPPASAKPDTCDGCHGSKGAPIACEIALSPPSIPVSAMLRPFRLCQECGRDAANAIGFMCIREGGWSKLEPKKRKGKPARESEDLRLEIARLNALINVPGTDDFFANVRHEAAHQIERWGVEHDAGKRPEDWCTLLLYLLGKAAKAHFEGNEEKLLHHVITVAAVALNWHRNATGAHTAMRPGVGP